MIRLGARRRGMSSSHSRLFANKLVKGTNMNGERRRVRCEHWSKVASLFFVLFFAMTFRAQGQAGPSGADQILSAIYDKSTNTIRVSSATGGGTVTSVGLSMPSEFSVTGSPITTGGTLSVLWAQPLSIADGGTGQSTAAGAFNALAPPTSSGGLIYGTGANTYGNLLLGSSGQCLQSSGTTLVWGSCGTGSSGIFQVNGTGLFSSTTVNFENSAAMNGLTLTFANPSAGNVQLGLAGTLSVAGGGTGTSSPALTAGSNISITGTWPNNTILLSGTVPVVNGGTGLTGVGSSGQCLTSTGSAMAWGSCGPASSFTAAGDLSGTSTSQTVIGLEGRPLSSLAPSSGQMLEWNGTAWTPTTLAGLGAVTSVGLSLPAIFNVTGTPVTGAGTLAGTLANESANTVFAGPSTGAAATPGFRPLAGADIPTINLGVSGNGGVTGLLSLANGGTGTASPALVGGANISVTGSWPNNTIAFSGTLPVANGGTGLTAVGTSGQCLTSTGALMAWSSCGSAGSAFQVNGTGLSSSSIVNFENSAAANGLTLSFSNPSAGNVQLGLSGTLSVAGGGTGTSSPALVGGSNISISGTWPNNTISFSGTLPVGNGGTGLTSLGSSGQCLGTNGSTMQWQSCGSGSGTVSSVGLSLPSAIFTVSGSPVTSAGTLTGTLANQSANTFFMGPASGSAAPAFRAATAADLAASPVTNDCLGYNGSTLAWLGCSGGSGGLPSSWTLNATTNAVTAQPISGQDAVPLTVAPDVASPTADLFDVYKDSGLTTKAFWVDASGNINWLGNTLKLGSNNQSTASYLELYGGMGTSAYVELLSPSLPPPAQLQVSDSTSGGTVGAGTYSFWADYQNGPGNIYTTEPSILKQLTISGSTNTLTITPPTQISGAQTWHLYGELQAMGVLVDLGLKTDFTTPVTLSSWSNSPSGTLPTTNDTGGLYPTYLSAGNEEGGDACVMSGVPGQNCAAGTWIMTDPLLGLGDIPYGAAVNADSFAQAARLTAPTTNGTYCLQEVVTASTPVAPIFGSCPSGGGAPGGSTTQIQYNNVGVFGGAANVTYNSSTGQFTANQLANSNQTIFEQRFTDTSPTGNFLDFQNAAGGTDLFKVAVTGAVTEGATTITSLTDSGGLNVQNGSTTNFSGNVILNAASANLILNGGKGQHIELTGTNSDTAGAIPIAASTSGAYSFTTPWTSAPVCVVSQQGLSASPTVFFGVGVTTTTLTVYASASGTYTVGYHCVGNPN